MKRLPPWWPTTLWLLLITASWLCLGATAHAAEPPVDVSTVRRFAVVVGANDGGAERVRLRYATRDAEAMSKVLRDLGGVAGNDLIELRDPTPDELREALEDIAARLRRAGGARTQFVFYYSGHSDERGLLLGEESVDYKTLRERVQAVGADVRIAILDSCASGAFTRAKGGRRRAPFLAGSVAKVEGHAFLTSSSADEAAQESDRIGGSFFTHFLSTGLRGAADVDGDRRVTLIEAYEFAFDETLARTETSRGGAQHAAYDIQLAGSGDLVLTDLRKHSATLTLAPDVGGRILVREYGGRLVAELYKPADSQAVDLALEPGRYQVTVDDEGALRRGEFEVASRGRATVRTEQLRSFEPEPTVRRGSVPQSEDLLYVPIDFGLLPPVSINAKRTKAAGHEEHQVRNRATFSLLWGRSARVDGVALAFGASVIDRELHGVQGALLVSLARGRVEGWQFSQGFNFARRLYGAQTGFINYAKDVEKGAQLGIVSVGGRVRGVQLGLFTYAEDADAALGLLTITKKGNVHPEIYTSDTAAFNVALRFPARYTYSMVTFGLHPFGDGTQWLAGAGLGGHAPLAHRLFLDVDVVTQAVLQVGRRPAGLGQLRIMFGWQPFERLAVFGGPTLSVFAHEDVLADTNEPERPGYGWVVADARRSDVRFRIWPGFVAGLRF